MINFFNVSDKDKYIHLDDFFEANNLKNIMLVCGKSIEKYWINEYFLSLEKRKQIKTILFQDFQPNPEMKDVIRGKAIFELKECDGIIAVGGGSAIDVAKGIKYYLDEKILDIPFLAIPTTAGTGSEATHFAVIYVNGEKISIANKNLMPNEVILDGTLLEYLPLYHKRAAMMDSYCHAIESFWSVQSTKESIQYAKDAIILIQDNYKKYLSAEQDEEINYKMLMASNYAGSAINISKTTAGHAMSYKLTSLYGIAHGHAVALCVERLWYHLMYNINIDIGDKNNHLGNKIKELCKIMQSDSLQNATETFSKVVNYMNFLSININNKDIELLKKSVNIERLQNYPFNLSEDEIEDIYKTIK